MTVDTGNLTLMDWAAHRGPKGFDKIVEILSLTNELILDMPWIECNNGDSHSTTVRVGLPSAIWRDYYKGVPPSKSQVSKVKDTCGMLEARASVDKDLANLNHDRNAFRLSEARAFVESMNQEMAKVIFYGNVKDNPFTGLTARYNALPKADDHQSSTYNVIDAGGKKADKNTSIWLIGWGENTVHGIFPKGSKAGLEHQDLGEGDASDDEGHPYRAYSELWKWHCGLAVRDWRYIVRIANIDTDTLLDTSVKTDLIVLMCRAIERIPNQLGKLVFYANRQVREALKIQALNKSSNALSITAAGKQFTTSFFDVPLRTCDILSNKEPLVK